MAGEFKRFQQTGFHFVDFQLRPGLTDYFERIAGRKLLDHLWTDRKCRGIVVGELGKRFDPFGACGDGRGRFVDFCLRVVRELIGAGTRPVSAATLSMSPIRNRGLGIQSDRYQPPSGREKSGEFG